MPASSVHLVAGLEGSGGGDIDPCPVRRRPGGRTAAVRRAVAESVLSFLRDGDVTFGVAEVAERAGVHRSTVYRRWPNRRDLVSEALRLHNSRFRVPDTGSFDSDIAGLAGALEDFFSDPVVVAANALYFSRTDPEFGRAVQERWWPLVEGMRTIADRALERGEITDTAGFDAVSELLISVLLIRSQFPRPPLERVPIDHLVAVLCGGHRSLPGATSRRSAPP